MRYGSPLPSAQRHLFLPSPQVVQAGPVEGQRMNFSWEHLSPHHPKPSLDAARYLQAHRAGGTRETSGSFVTFLTKEALLPSGPRLSISSLKEKGLLSPGHTWGHTNPIPPLSAPFGQQQCQAGIIPVLPKRLFWGTKMDFC